MTRCRAMWERLQRMLLKRGINTVLEVVLWIALFYSIFGVGYTVLHIELMSQLESALSGQFTIFADLAALAVMLACWPLLLASSLLCGAAGCGVF